jgi:hypothetical protein
VGGATVAIGTPDIALLDLGDQEIERTLAACHRGNVPQLDAPDMIELQDDRIGLPAVDTGMIAFVLFDVVLVALSAHLHPLAS